MSLICEILVLNNFVYIHNLDGQQQPITFIHMPTTEDWTQNINFLLICLYVQ